MPTKIFVGSLGNGARPEELRGLFESYGNVVECDIVNRCGFVHMENEQDAQAAIQNLNNSSFNGQTITVEYGRQKERGGGGGASRGMRSGPYDHRGGGGGGGGSWPGRGGFNRGPLDGGMGRGGYRNSSHSPLGGGYGGGGRPGGSFRSNGEDRRGFALPDNDDYNAGAAGGGDLFHRRAGSDNYRNGYSRDYERGYGTDTYQQRDSGPIRRGANGYEGSRGSQYQRGNDYQDHSRSSGYGGYAQQSEGYSGSGQYGSNYSSERNTNYSSPGGRNTYGGQGTSRAMPPDQYSRRF